MDKNNPRSRWLSDVGWRLPHHHRMRAALKAPSSAAWALGAPLHCCRLTHWMQRLAARRPPLVSCLRGKVPRPKMVSSNQKRFQLCLVRNSPRGTSEPRVFHQNGNPARVRVRGRGLGNPHLVVYEGPFVTRAPFRKFTDAAKPSSRNVVLWDFCDTWRIF